MTSDFKTRFHKAARDGAAAQLQEITREEASWKDDDGRTPVHAAAFAGKVDALKVLMRRGGNADKCDYHGNTPLHLAAQNGHVECVKYLVNVGANIWVLDNSGHLPKDVAFMCGNQQILDYFDQVLDVHERHYPGQGEKMRQKAEKEYEKRIKKIEKLAKKTEKQLYDEQMEIIKATAKRMDDNRRKTTTAPPATVAPKMYSEFVAHSRQQTSLSDAMKRKTQTEFKISSVNRDGQRDSHLLQPVSGFQRDSEIMFAKSKIRPAPVLDDDDDDTVSDGSFNPRPRQLPDTINLFERPEGTFSFLKKPGMTNGILSLPKESPSLLDEDEASASSPTTTDENSIGTLGSLANRNGGALPWNDSEIDLEDASETPSFLEMFLAANDLVDLFATMRSASLDKESLLLMTEKHLEQFSVPLGPRLKLVRAIDRRRKVLGMPGPLDDAEL